MRVHGHSIGSRRRYGGKGRRRAAVGKGVHDCLVLDIAHENLERELLLRSEVGERGLRARIPALTTAGFVRIERVVEREPVARLQMAPYHPVERGATAELPGVLEAQ